MIQHLLVPVRFHCTLTNNAVFANNDLKFHSLLTLSWSRNVAPSMTPSLFQRRLTLPNDDIHSSVDQQQQLQQINVNANNHQTRNNGYILQPERPQSSLSNSSDLANAFNEKTILSSPHNEAILKAAQTANSYNSTARQPIITSPTKSDATILDGPEDIKMIFSTSNRSSHISSSSSNNVKTPWCCPFRCGAQPYQRTSRRTIKQHMIDCLRFNYPQFNNIEDAELPEELLKFDINLYFALKDAFLLPREQKPRRNISELEESCRWTCPYQCGQQYRITSTKSIQNHLTNPNYQCNQIKNGGKRDDSVNSKITCKRKYERSCNDNENNKGGNQTEEFEKQSKKARYAQYERACLRNSFQTLSMSRRTTEISQYHNNTEYDDHRMSLESNSPTTDNPLSDYHIPPSTIRSSLTSSSSYTPGLESNRLSSQSALYEVINSNVDTPIQANEHNYSKHPKLLETEIFNNKAFMIHNHFTPNTAQKINSSGEFFNKTSIIYQNTENDYSNGVNQQLINNNYNKQHSAHHFDVHQNALELQKQLEYITNLSNLIKNQQSKFLQTTIGVLD